jgi:hypothetical protein
MLTYELYREKKLYLLEIKITANGEKFFTLFSSDLYCYKIRIYP